jgi:dTDP-4-dehydrorhamnose reductase
MTILVSGSKGMLGWDIVKLLAWNNITHIAFDKEELDICNELQIHRILRNHRISLFINCAAYTDVLKAEEEISIVKRINSDALGPLAKACRQYSVGLLHFSTDFIFDGCQHSPYLEDDEAFPLNVYGQSKYEGEKQISQNNDNFKILRLQWLYGKNGNNFLYKIIDAYKQTGYLKIVNDQFGSPCSAEFVASIILNFIMRWDVIPTGVYHLTHDDHCSWYEFARYAFERLNLADKVEPISYKDLNTKVVRPNFGVMSNSKLKRQLDIKSLGCWKDDVDHFFRQYGYLL